MFFFCEPAVNISLAWVDMLQQDVPATIFSVMQRGLVVVEVQFVLSIGVER
jgi:hypothetical protein